MNTTGLVMTVAVSPLVGYSGALNTTGLVMTAAVSPVVDYSGTPRDLS